MGLISGTRLHLFCSMLSFVVYMLHFSGHHFLSARGCCGFSRGIGTRTKTCPFGSWGSVFYASLHWGRGRSALLGKLWHHQKLSPGGGSMASWISFLPFYSCFLRILSLSTTLWETTHKAHNPFVQVDRIPHRLREFQGRGPTDVKIHKDPRNGRPSQRRY